MKVPETMTSGADPKVVFGPEVTNRLVAHTVYGWRDRDLKGFGRVPHTESVRMGHTWDTGREGASRFPTDWTEQDIEDALVVTVENPDRVNGPRESKCIHFKQVRGE